ncbi:MAG: hypothetical protein K8F52_06055 [Candidatus Scalindua rubra]|nr:hypothetical protein [Candidatus Scalindua rubra]
MGSNIGEKIHAIIDEKEVSIQNIPYFTSKANAIRHETGNTTHGAMRR